MHNRTRNNPFKESNMNERIFNKVLTLLIAGAIIGSIIYGLYCLLGLIGCIIYCSVMVALLCWIAEDIRHAATEDQQL